MLARCAAPVSPHYCVKTSTQGSSLCRDGYQAHRLLIAAVGSRLASFAANGPRLDMHTWIQTREALTAITVCKSGLIAAVGPTQSAVVYSYGNLGFQVVCADPVSRSPVACLPLHTYSGEDPQVCTWIILFQVPTSRDTFACARLSCLSLYPCLLDLRNCREGWVIHLTGWHGKSQQCCACSIIVTPHHACRPFC